MIKYILSSLIILILISCSNNVNTAIAIETTHEPISKNWIGTWERNDWQNEASIEIKAIKNDSIAFSISAVSGGNSGDVDGVAHVNKNVAVYLRTDDTDTCLIVFTLSNDSIITIDQQKGFCFAGMGVWYSGKYVNKKFIKSNTSSMTLFNLEIFRTKEQDSIFKELVGSNYDLFLNSTQLIYEVTDEDSLHAVVISSGLRGMYTSMGNIIMIDSTNTIWAAVIDDNKVLYFTNSEKYKNTVPKTIDEWRKDFKQYEVVYK